MNHSNLISIDLAKDIIQVCKITKHGEYQFNKAMKPQKLKEFLAKAEPSIVAMEGCGGCHYWSRLAQIYGHEVRVISPRRVKAFLQGHKTDANDAVAIAMASTQVGMRFCHIKTEEQQILQTLETTRKFLDKERTALGNHIRAYLYEYGITANKGRKALKQVVLQTLDGDCKALPEGLKGMLRMLWDRYTLTHDQLKQAEAEKSSIVKSIEPCKRLMELEGIGEVCAGMLYACMGDGSNFKNGRHASAYIGVTPKQHSSGGKTYMIGIDKVGGHKDLRVALYQGALAVISRLPDNPRTTKQAWLIELVKRIGIKRACIALANKTVRTAWALLATGNHYEQAMLQA
jgi:transposase